MHTVRWLVIGASGVALAGCAGTPGATYRGAEHPFVAAPGQVDEAGSLPPAHELIGKATARCTLVEHLRRLDDEVLADVDCSVTRLTRALRERASKVGGTVIVDKQCSSRRLVDERFERRTSVTCRAGVARAEHPSLQQARTEPVVSPPLPSPGWGPRATDAWRIRVDYTPADDGYRPARRASVVRELAELPVSHRRLGDVVARCEQGCSEDAVHEGVVATAGRMGATDVVGVRCAEHGSGWMCTGTAAGYERDLEQIPAAR